MSRKGDINGGISGKFLHNILFECKIVGNYIFGL